MPAKTPGLRRSGSSRPPLGPLVLIEDRLKWHRAARFDVGSRLCDDAIKPSDAEIGRHLAVPLVISHGMEHGHQLAVFPRREPVDCSLDFTECYHPSIVLPAARPEQLKDSPANGTSAAIFEQSLSESGRLAAPLMLRARYRSEAMDVDRG